MRPGPFERACTNRANRGVRSSIVAFARTGFDVWPNLFLEFGGAPYHVTARGDRREAVYEEDADCEHFLEVPGEVAG